MATVASQSWGATAAVDFHLRGVLISPGSSSALINGEVAREGESVAGIRILSIDQDAVRVLSGTVETSVPVGSRALLSPSTALVRQASGHRVRRGETLSRIAERYLVDGVTRNQLVVALFEANPHAFDGNLNRLREGAELRIPDLDDTLRFAPEIATAEVL